MKQTKKAQPATVKITVNFPADLWRDLRLQAIRDGETATAVLVRLAQGYLKKK